MGVLILAAVIGFAAMFIWAIVGPKVVSEAMAVKGMLPVFIVVTLLVLCATGTVRLPSGDSGYETVPEPIPTQDWSWAEVQPSVPNQGDSVDIVLIIAVAVVILGFVLNKEVRIAILALVGIILVGIVLVSLLF